MYEAECPCPYINDSNYFRPPMHAYNRRKGEQRVVTLDYFLSGFLFAMSHSLMSVCFPVLTIGLSSLTRKKRSQVLAILSGNLCLSTIADAYVMFAWIFTIVLH